MEIWKSKAEEDCFRFLPSVEMTVVIEEKKRKKRKKSEQKKTVLDFSFQSK